MIQGTSNKQDNLSTKDRQPFYIVIQGTSNLSTKDSINVHRIKLPYSTKPLQEDPFYITGSVSGPNVSQRVLYSEVRWCKCTHSFLSYEILTPLLSLSL